MSKKDFRKGAGAAPRFSIAKQAAESVVRKKAIEDIFGRSLPDWVLELSQIDIEIDSIKYVLLLNAHGGEDPETGEYVTKGKRSPKWDDKPPKHGENIIYEGISSRDFIKDIRFYLRVLGIPCEIVNDTWKDTPIASKRYAALKIKRDNPGNYFALELHSNATKEMKGKASGFEFFTYPGLSLSDKIAGILGQEFDREIPEFTHRRTKPGVEKEARFGILKMDPLYVEAGFLSPFTEGIPIVLSESGFMDNRKDCFELLIDPAGRERIVKFHVKAIIRTINELF